MDKVYIALIDVLTIIENFSFYYVIWGKRVKWENRNKWHIGICIFLVLLIMLNCCMDDLLFFPILIYSYFGFSIICNIPQKENLITAIITFLVTLVTENITKMLLNYFFEWDAVINSICYILGSMAMLWIYYVFLGKRKKKEIFQLSSVMSVLVMVMLFIMDVMLIFFSVVVEDTDNIRIKSMGMLLIAVGGMAVCILIFIMIYYFNNTKRYKVQNELLEKYNEQQREYFTKLLEKEQETKQFRHDIINHLLELQSYCKNANYDDLNQYLKSMLGEIKDIREKQYDVGNDIVNTMINYYFLPIKDTCRISVKGQIGAVKQMEQKDLCTIISNITKNAVEAVKKLAQPKREIIFKVSEGKKYLRIEMENTFSGDIKIGRDGLPETKKADALNHGLGLKNVQTVVEKYQGKLEITTENQRYFVKIHVKK